MMGKKTMLAKDMNTVCLLGSPRRGGNSDTLAESFVAQAGALGAPVETFALSEMNYGGCRNLFRCKTDLDHCAQKDDLTPVLAAVARAQVLVLASPVYFTSVSAQMKMVIDRFFSLFRAGLSDGRKEKPVVVGPARCAAANAGRARGQIRRSAGEFRGQFYRAGD